MRLHYTYCKDKYVNALIKTDAKSSFPKRKDSLAERSWFDNRGIHFGASFFKSTRE